MKKLLPVLFLALMFGLESAAQTDSLQIIASQRNTLAVRALISLAQNSGSHDSSIAYAQKGLNLAMELGDKKGEAECRLLLTLALDEAGRHNEALEQAFVLEKLYKELNDHGGLTTIYLFLQGIYREAISDYRKSLYYALQGEKIARQNKVTNISFFPGHRAEPLFDAEIAGTYIQLGIMDSAQYYVDKAIKLNETFNGSTWNFPIFLLGRIEYINGEYSKALNHYRIALPLAKQNNVQSQHDTLQVYSGMSSLFLKTGLPDSAIHYATMVAFSDNPDQEPKHLLEAYFNLASAYKLLGPKDSAIKYIELSHALNDSLFSIHKDREIQNISFNQSLREQELKSEQQRLRARIQTIILISGLLLVLIVAVLFWRNNKKEHEAKQKIERAYDELKSAQKQLIHAEKMASLGELTAGIAHEIQNPLNFVNNFSEINIELLTELRDSLKRGENGVAEELLNSLDENERKVIHHSKRADGIVKAMLQHSRGSSGVKEPTDINSLCRDYLQLSYHGMRATDKSFNARLQTEFDESLGNANLIAQDIGRVLLNLLNNAFYATREKKSIAGSDYEPTIIINTKKNNNQVEIIVSDNGIGIKKELLGKIFQPFFTTKPAGQGAGLGLSLSYDIIKAHGGDLQVETSDGNGSSFRITLPIS